MVSKMLISLSTVAFLYVGCSLAHNCYEATVPRVQNGYVSTGPSYEGATRSVVCNIGYQRTDASQYIVCRNGHWSTPAVQCVRGAPVARCPYNQFTCNNGRCIPTTWYCDGRNDCGDLSDEDCQRPRPQTCNSHQFACANGNCIWNSWKCDGENDCGDWSDEPQTCLRLVPRYCQYNEFRCSNGACIPQSWMCDGDNDCGDFSDEMC